jgi:RND family efflux transporter MFP subunit
LGAGVRWHDQIDQRLAALFRDADRPGAAPASAQLWTCGMHPQVIQDHPGKCPICHMELVPLQAGDAALPEGGAPGAAPATPAPGGEVVIDPVIVQNMGVRTATAGQGPLIRSIRAVGYLNEAEPLVRDINLRISGWVQRLHADTEGLHVEAGDPLFDLYSPELQVAVEELINARRADAGRPDQDAPLAKALYDAAVRKLELAGLPRAQIQALAKADRAPEAITFPSPVPGTITEKLVVEGASVKAGDRVLRIVDHSTLWIDARISEKDLPLVSLGQSATATIASQPGEALVGRVVFIAPKVDPETRTATVRLAVPNPDLTLKPGMYAVVRIAAEIAAQAVTVPREAVIDTGESQVVFIARAAGRFEPRRVTMGPAGDNGQAQILDGLGAGETVVVSGQFLLDSESRLREAVRKFLAREAPSTPPGPGSSPAPQAAVDALLGAYLETAAALAAAGDHAAPVDAEPLASASRDLREQAAGPAEPLATEISAAADAMKGAAIEQQRTAFRRLSGSMIALLDASPPSPTMRADLYIIHCPMLPGDWVQHGRDIVNPFFGPDMLTCGEVVRAIGPGAEANP